MNYSDFTAKISGFSTSRWEDKVTATKINTHEDPPERVFKSGLLIVLISIVFICFTGNNYDISLQLYFLLFIAEHSGLLAKIKNVWLFLYGCTGILDNLLVGGSIK